MPQILYLNSVRFLFFVPSEDCSCKIHGLRVGITRASRGWTYQVHSLFPSFFPCSLLLMGASAGKNGDEGNIHVSNKNIGLVQMHLCLISMVLLPGEENNSHQNYTFLWIVPHLKYYNFKVTRWPFRSNCSCILHSRKPFWFVFLQSPLVCSKLNLNSLRKMWR